MAATASSRTPLDSPQFLGDARTLMEVLRGYTVHELEKIMDLSPKLATGTRELYQHWGTGPARAALLAYRGDLYDGLDADSLGHEQFELAQEKVRIISGLYGMLRPRDAIHPYRLEMATVLPLKNHHPGLEPETLSLTRYWKKKLETALEECPTVVNLMSGEYARVVSPGNRRVISPRFEDWTPRGYRVLSYQSKRARGFFARWLLESGTCLEGRELEQRIRTFSSASYSWQGDLSSPDFPVFRALPQS